jgi:hypothetical protein
LGNAESTSDADALEAYNAVRARSISGYTNATEITLDQLLEERRRELAYEGDSWFDYVRLHYYQPVKAKQMLAAQERGTYSGNATTATITLNSQHYTPDDGDFAFPFPEGDLLKNPNLGKEPVPYDFSKMPEFGRK